MQTKLKTKTQAQIMAMTSVGESGLPRTGVSVRLGFDFEALSIPAAHRVARKGNDPAGSFPGVQRGKASVDERETKEGAAMVLQMVQKTDQQTDVEFYTRCRKLARAKGYPQDIWEDFPSWAYERMKLGSRARIDQLLIDYLRTTYGVTGTDGQRLRKALNTASDNSLGLDLIEASATPSPSARLESDQLWGLANGRDREMLQLYFQEGLSKKEIADQYGVTEARVCQLMKNAMAKMRVALEGP